MATQNKFNSFVSEVVLGTHTAFLTDGVDTDTLRVVLTNNQPAATNTILSDITEIDYTNCDWSTGGEDILNASTQTAGVITVVATDVTCTASGVLPDFQYIVIYNDEAGAGTKLVSWADNGSVVQLTSGQTFTINFGASLLTVT